ncbi:signal peptide protein [Streptomyces sp. NPDC056492]|uniref:signal peptide protein n=1 Tax=unclassified Streptomyces TaxID=2593676 RepID=UPI003688B867
MPPKKIRAWVPTIAAAAAVVAVATPAVAGTGKAAPPQAAIQAQGDVVREVKTLTQSPMPADQKQHEVTVTYLNESPVEEEVGPQIVFASPDEGPYLKPSDIKLERFTEAGGWEPVKLLSQSGSLYTELSLAKRQLPENQTLTERFRFSVVTAGAVGTVYTQVAIFE